MEMMSSTGTPTPAQHHFRKVIPGDIEGVRRRLSDVLEDFNYVVLGENPIQAKRAAQRNFLLASVLEYETRLTVALKPISQASTIATFDYTVSYIFSKGDRIALEREADAIIAMINAPRRKSVCPSCGTENAGAVKFCRVCGMLIAPGSSPAEIEVMRLMSSAASADIELRWGAMWILLTLLVTIPMILFGNPKMVKVGWLFFAAGEAFGFFCLLFGIWRLNRTVNASPSVQSIAHSDSQAITGSLEHTPGERAALPPQPDSVVEGTTRLMEEQPVPLRPAKNTDPIE
jgi:hypothetical protein